MKKIIHLIFAIFIFAFYSNAQSYCTTGLSSYGCSWNTAINDFSLANIQQTETGCGGDVSDYTSLTINLSQGESYLFNLTSSSNSYNTPYEYAGIWIDLDDNYSFEDAGELLFSSATGGIFSGVLSVPVTAPIGNHRLRVRLKFDYNGPFTYGNSCFQYYYGEAHDYTVNISSAPSCIGLSSLSVTSITISTAIVSWECNGCSDPFIVEYGPTGFTPGMSNDVGISGTIINAPQSPVNLTNLSSSTYYDVYVRRNCEANGYSLNFGPFTFITNYDYCGTLKTIDCGTEIEANIPTGDGGVFEGSGKELLYAFTPTQSGGYTFTVISSDNNSITYFIKDATGGCNDKDWIYLTEYGYNYTGTSVLGQLEANHTYYIMLDAKYPENGVVQTFRVDCYDPSVPCEEIETITCGVLNEATIPAGVGSFNTTSNMPYDPGREKIFKFTPSLTGPYTLIFEPANNWYSVGVFFKKASDGCINDNWHFINNHIDTYNKRTLFIGTLLAGVDYYIMLDAYSINGATRNFLVDCYQPANPCNNIETISCGSEVTYEVQSGIGSIVPDVCLNNSQTSSKIGREKIFQFTPTTTGKAALWIKSHTFDLYEGFFFKEASSGCNKNNWQCIKYLNSGEKILLPGILTAGTTYYLMADVWGLDGGSIKFEITCPEESNSCNTITQINCAVPVSSAIPVGIGKFELHDAEDPYYYGGLDGKEVIYSFSPSVSGSHQITVTETDYKPPSYELKFVTYFIKDAADGCNEKGWTKITSAVMPPYPWDSPIYFPYPLIQGHTYYIMLDGAYNGANQTFVITCPEMTYPCDIIVTGITCNTEYTFSNAGGLGQFNPLPELNSFTGYGGKESLFEFTPSISGTYQIELVSASDYNNVGYFVKEASDGCNKNKWEFIGSYLYPGQSATFPLILNAGTSYYIMADGETAGKVFKINCPSVFYNPCSTITTITECKSSIQTVHTSGLGQFPDHIGNFFQKIQTPGKERIFSFTPVADGIYGLKVEAGGTGQLIYFIKKANEGCNETGWLYLEGEYYGYGFQVKIPMELKGGETYYIMTDAVNTDGADQTFKIICPTEDPCKSFTTIEACGWENDVEATLPAGINSYLLTPCFNDYQKINGGTKMFAFSPTVSGYYSIEIHDSYYSNQYFFVKDASLGCGGNDWSCMATNYYNTYYSPFPFLQGHTYYILVAKVTATEETSNLTFHLNCTSGIVQYADKDGDGYGDANNPLYDQILTLYGYTYETGDCNDQNLLINPSATEICGNNIDDDCDGKIDEDCCNITVDAGADITSYYGYPSTQSITRTATITGGKAPFSYSWTMNRPLTCNSVNKDGDESFSTGTCTNAICPVTGSLSVPPVCNGNAAITAKLMTTATICVTVTDANGCTATDCFVINAKDIRCFSKDNSNTKVLVCHKGKTTCVNLGDVLLHLAHGDNLGACTSFAENNRISTEEKEQHSEFKVSAYPNPSDNMFTVNVESNSNETVELKVYDVLGRVVYSTKGSANRKYEFGNKFISGAYVVEVRQGLNRSAVKLIKQ